MTKSECHGEGSAPTVPGYRPYGDDVVGVVGLALVNRLEQPERLLAARRCGPADGPGGWELPGGKVEPGESWHAAATREIEEELGVDVRLGSFLVGPDNGRLWRVGPRHVMAVWLAEVSGGVPVAGPAHDALRWLDAQSLYDVPWLPGDEPVVRALEPLLLRAGSVGCSPGGAGASPRACENGLYGPSHPRRHP